MDDPVDDVDDGCDGSHLAGAHDDVGAGDDPVGVGGPLEKRPGQPGLVHGVQIYEQVERFELVRHGVLLSDPWYGFGRTSCSTSSRSWSPRSRSENAIVT